MTDFSTMTQEERDYLVKDKLAPICKDSNLIGLTILTTRETVCNLKTNEIEDSYTLEIKKRYRYDKKS